MIDTGNFWIVGLVALSAAAAGCTAQQKAQQSEPPAQQQQQAVVTMPVELQTAVQDAESWGRALYDSYVAPKATSDKAVERAIATVHQAVRDHCSGTYRAVAVMPPSAPKDRIVIYDIGEAPAQGIMVGRHYRVETTLDGKGVLLGEPSTTGCITLPPATASATAPSLVRHDLSPAPNEYHVFLSLMYRRSLDVVTEAGHWLVEQGKIRYVGRG